jgi:hypothetical protein
MREEKTGIIYQHDKYTGLANERSYDDSAARTGIMSMCGSQIDTDNIHKFLDGMNCKIVRHPDHAWANDPKNTSRDQLVQWCAGIRHPQSTMPVAFYWSNKWFINKDFLSPDVRLYLRKTSYFDASPMLEFWGMAFHYAAILWSAYVDRKEECNQLICISMRLGTIKFLVKHKKNLFEVIREYWGDDVKRDLTYPDIGWRSQPEISQMIIAKITSEVMK